MARGPRSPGTRRTVHFHRARLPADQAWNPRDAVQRLRRLRGDQRYVDLGEDTVLLALADPPPADREEPCALQLLRVRRSALPAVERAGMITSLEIPADAGIADQTHVLLAPDSVVAVEYNHFGPRVGHLAWLLRERLDLDVALPVYLTGDAFEVVERLRDVRLVTLSMQPTTRLAQELFANTLASALYAAEASQEAKQLSLRLTAEPNSHSITARAKGLIRRLRDEDRLNELDSLKVRGFDPVSGSPETIDLLRGKVAREIYVTSIGPRERRLSPQSAYAELAGALASARADLARAALVG